MSKRACDCAGPQAANMKAPRWAKVVHYEYGGEPLCNARHKKHCAVSPNETEVTCERCLVIYGQSDARPANAMWT